jgi:hypothetical protein
VPSIDANFSDCVLQSGLAGNCFNVSTGPCWSSPPFVPNEATPMGRCVCDSLQYSPQVCFGRPYANGFTVRDTTATFIAVPATSATTAVVTNGELSAGAAAAVAAVATFVVTLCVTATLCVAINARRGKRAPGTETSTEDAKVTVLASSFRSADALTASAHDSTYGAVQMPARAFGLCRVVLRGLTVRDSGDR